MLHLHRLGVIRLPPPRWTPPNNVVARRSAPPVKVDETPLGCSLQELAPLTILQVRRTQKERLFDSLLHRFHYLGYKRPVGAHLKHLVLAGDRPVACVLWSSAPRHLGPRDRFIGWSAQARRHNVHLLAYNPRYLILPWVRVPHLASHLLGRMARMLPRAWEEVYGHRLLYLETFVDPSRFAGTCYRAANWIVLGRTTGRGNNAPTREPRVPVKEILGYPLSRRFREELSRIP